MIDATAWIAPSAVVLGDVQLGVESSIWYHSVLRGDMAPIIIGDHTNIQDLSMVHVDEGVPCTIGDRVGVGHRAILHGCTVEDEALIGMGAILLNHATVGAGAVVGAGSVVPEGMEIPAGMLAVGVPAQVLRPVYDELRERVKHTWQHYVAQAKRHAAGDFPPRRGS